MLRGFEITRSKLIAWVKRHLLISTAIGIFLGYIAYQLVTTVLVVCRDAYVTADIVAIAPEVSGPMATLGVTDNQPVDNLERAYKVAQAELNESRAARVVIEQEVAVQSAQVQQVQAAVAKAQWELSRTEVKSEVKGRVAPFVIRPGSFCKSVDRCWRLLPIIIGGW